MSWNFSGWAGDEVAKIFFVSLCFAGLYFCFDFKAEK